MNAGELMQSTEETVRSVLRMVHDIQGEGAATGKQVTIQKCRWKPPPPDVLKINCDGSFKPESKLGAWGFVIRNNEGTTILAGARSLGVVHDALLAETMACKHAIEAAEHFGISQVMIETDSSQLKEALSSLAMDLAVGVASLAIFVLC